MTAFTFDLKLVLYPSCAIFQPYSKSHSQAVRRDACRLVLIAGYVFSSLGSGLHMGPLVWAFHREKSLYRSTSSRSNALEGYILAKWLSNWCSAKPNANYMQQNRIGNNFKSSVQMTRAGLDVRGRRALSLTCDADIADSDSRSTSTRHPHSDSVRAEPAGVLEEVVARPSGRLPCTSAISAHFQLVDCAVGVDNLHGEPVR